jgi:2-iminobutanoate/2-iminopropanoate deaminase
MKALISSDKVPAPPGPYSPGLTVGEWIFLSGQGGFDPNTGKVVSDDLAEQTEQTFNNIETVLEAAGASLDDVISCLVHSLTWLTSPRSTPSTSRSSPE